jgi:hypothetical protein
MKNRTKNKTNQTRSKQPCLVDLLIFRLDDYAI